MLRLCGVEYESLVDAPGVTAVLFFSGCRHHCPGCHNPKTHDFSYGVEVTDELISRINAEIDKRPFLRGLVLSGGDPMYSAREILELLPKLHIPNGNLWCYTGFKIEEITDRPMLELVAKCTHLVDGPFVEDLRDATLCYRGSSNQRIWQIYSDEKEGCILIDMTDKISPSRGNG